MECKHRASEKESWNAIDLPVAFIDIIQIVYSLYIVYRCVGVVLPSAYCSNWKINFRMNEKQAENL